MPYETTKKGNLVHHISIGYDESLNEPIDAFHSNLAMCKFCRDLTPEQKAQIDGLAVGAIICIVYDLIM